MSLHEATALAHKNPKQTMPSCGRLFIQTWRHNKLNGASQPAPRAELLLLALPVKLGLLSLSRLCAENPPAPQGNDPCGTRHLRCRAHLSVGKAQARTRDHGLLGREAAANHRGRDLTPPLCMGSCLVAPPLLKGWARGRAGRRRHERGRGGERQRE